TAVAVLARVATLCARAGDADGAVDVLEEAAEDDPDAALPHELRGTIAGWASVTIAPAQADEAFTLAAERRARGGSDPFENLLRAFEIDPASTLAADALSEALAGRGKRLAADEVRREHARALRATDPMAAAAVHRGRRDDAIAQGALARALGAALDEGLARGGLDDDADLDELLVRAGIHQSFSSRAALFEPTALDRAADAAPPNVRPVLLSFAAELL